MACGDIEPWWAHFIARRLIREASRQKTTTEIPKYLGNCQKALERLGTFVPCCVACHGGHNWREVHTEDGWYQACCKVEDVAKRRRKK